MKEESLLVANTTIKYSVRESRLAKRMRVAVYADGDVVVTKPMNVSFENLKSFVEAKKLWIIKKTEEKKIAIVPELKENSRMHYLLNKSEAKKLVKQKLEEWNEKLELEYRSFSIKNLKSRWGSCSSNKNLSFNYKILFLPEMMQDYIIVHELCHLKTMNHSKKFWALLGNIMPNYLSIKEKIKKI